ncbi:magnesium and cobalt transporter [Sphaerotilus sulfidivorans]|uniref:Magnesium and cobalt efflux protein CorC n=1 Tax=Sphaerotilus sulfidivorans TaxID=639200 RepID=A0A5C1PWE5_9BURK|nr:MULTISPECIES: transporter associated domain-containing protein [Sphaerotilus]GIX53454.1 cation transporter [Sphaerotilus natans]MCK6402615.1 CBS domain-containing protein [Sphaerotilus sulfidivorans]NZD44967.1 CBS domain-containing protein [Sphaerotilus sulfidivorans]QEM99627.1 CBS domain-containing protein [Sphaerotilus sulfidivorans]GKQ57875.1 cation transporter [Sphaerotilus sp. FB-3]
MSEPQPSSRSTADHRSLFARVIEFISPGPDSRDELMETLADAERRELIDPESRAMLEGVIRMADLTAGDAMVAAPRIDMIDIATPFDEVLDAVAGTGHSRFPVFEDSRDNIIGVLLAKDLLRTRGLDAPDLRMLLRPALFVPESKGLNELLRDFRSNRNHLAIVIDEFGGLAGMITIEDVLEQIVGEIEDEHDEKREGESGIYTLTDGSSRVAGDAAVVAVNAHFATDLPADEFETIGGLVAHSNGRVPRRGESVDVGPLRFAVMLTRGGAVRWFRVSRVPAGDDASGG